MVQERCERRPSLEAIHAEIGRIGQRRERRKEVAGIIGRILFVAMAVVLVNIYVLRIATVSGASMEPTLRDGDVVLCSPLGYEPDYGDIVVTELDVGGGDLVKRVAALAGDTVDIDSAAGTVSVNGKAIDEPYIMEAIHGEAEMNFPAVVPPGRVFLLGDNRNNSVDSRREVVGMVPESTILGKVVFRIWPAAGFGPM